MCNDSSIGLEPVESAGVGRGCINANAPLTEHNAIIAHDNKVAHELCRSCELLCVENQLAERVRVGVS